MERRKHWERHTGGGSGQKETESGPRSSRGPLLFATLHVGLLLKNMPLRCNGRNKSFHVPNGDLSVLSLLLFTIVANDNHAIHLFTMKVFNPEAMCLVIILWNATA